MLIRPRRAGTLTLLSLFLFFRDRSSLILFEEHLKLRAYPSFVRSRPLKLRESAHSSFTETATMAANRNRRLAKEISDVQKDVHSGVSLESSSKSKDGTSTFEDLTHFRGVFAGPPDTPYEGGKYYVDIKIPSEYPFQPPTMRFETKIWHPNVSSVTVGRRP